MEFSYDLSLLRQLIGDIHRLTGVSISVLDAELQPLVDYRNRENYCDCIHKTALAKNCLRDDNLLLERCKKSKKLEHHLCHQGLYDSAMPILKGETIAGFILMGQVRAERSPKRADPLYQKLPLFKEEQLSALYDLLPHILFHSAIRPKTNSLAEEIADFLLCHLSEKIRIEALSDRFHRSKNTLHRAFFARFGCGINEYLLKARIEHAKSLLQESSLSISEIAEVCGMEAAYFSRIFKKRMGCPPSDFRKNSD